MKIEEIMSSPAITCDYQTPIYQVAILMKEKNIGFVPIIKNDFIVGVVTDRDIVIRGVVANNINEPIEKIMTPNPLTVVPGMEAVTVAKLMAGQLVRRVIISLDGQAIGVASTKDLLKAPNTLYHVLKTYQINNTSALFREYDDNNPHDSIKIDDFPL